jgi:AcrR family transcriptional regulator
MATMRDPVRGGPASQVQQPESLLEKDERQQREERILETAAVLLVRWGYRKTTIDDVAREAGVGKGTIYLHWKDKNELFRAVLRNEQERCNADIKQRIAADPEGGLLHRAITHSMLAALANPLMATVMKGNTDIFNGFLGAYNDDLLAQMVDITDAYLAQLQNAGLVRRDIPVPVITFLMTALKVGLINSPDIMGQEHTPPIEQLTEALGDLVRRWLEPAQLPNSSDAGKQLLAEYLDKVKESE